MFSKCAKAGNIIEWSTLYKIPQEVQDNTVFIKRQVINTSFSRVQKFSKVSEICSSSTDPKIFNVFINFKNLVICNIRKRGTSFLFSYIYIYIYIYVKSATALSWFASDTVHFVFHYITSVVKPVHFFMARNRVSKSRFKG